MSASTPDLPELGLVVDLETQDGSGLPWAVLDEACRPARVREGARLVVGEGSTRAVAQVVEIDGNNVPTGRPRDP